MKIDRAHMLFAVMCLIWGATWIAVKAGINAVPSTLFAATRFVVAGAVLMVFVWWRGELGRIAWRDVPRFAAVTILMITATYALLFWGAHYVASGLASILDLAFMPVALLTIGTLLREDRFTRLGAAGVTVGVVGLAVLFGPKALASERTGHPMELWGAAAIVVSALVYSLGSVLARPLLRRYAPMVLSGVTTLGGGLLLLAGSLAFEPGALAALGGRWGMAAWAAWVFLVVGGSLIAFTIYLGLIGKWGASRAGAYAFVSPVFAVALGVVVFGEGVTVVDGIGMVTMLAGAWLTLSATQ